MSDHEADSNRILRAPAGDVDGIVAGSSSLDARLRAWLAEAEVEAAARARSQRRWLGQQAAEESSVSGVVLDWFEHGAEVIIECGTMSHRGRVRGLGRDFLVLDGAAVTLVALAAVTSMRSVDATPAVAGARPAEPGISLAELLPSLAAERTEVVVRPRTGPDVRGRLAVAGIDVIRVDRRDGSAHVPLAAVTSITVDP